MVRADRTPTSRKRYEKWGTWPGRDGTPGRAADVVGVGGEPQGLKPGSFHIVCGTTEVVPFPIAY